MSDNINHPSHYTSGSIECIDAIRASMTPRGFIDYCKGNVIKYVYRWDHKGGVEDLKKAQVYLGWAIEAAENLNTAHMDLFTSTEEREEIMKKIRKWQETADLRVIRDGNG